MRTRIQYARVLAFAALVGTTPVARAQMTEVVLHSFGGPLVGTLPLAGVIRDPEGNLYGTTTRSGGSGQGVVYKLDKTSNATALYTFTGGADGGTPTGELAWDTAGNIYGTTEFGGAGYGVVYKVDPGGQETVIYTFTGGSDGAYPFGGVIRDVAGNLYGATTGGGTTAGPCSSFPYGNLGCGVVFKLDTTGHETVLHTFTGGTDGGNTAAGVIVDHAGNLYGTVGLGGITNSFCSYGCGFVYRVSVSGIYSVLHNFQGGTGGGDPQGGLIRDAAGNLYGTTAISNPGSGVVYRLNPQGYETVLHRFAGTDGSVPFARLTLDASGSLYGTTSNGGPNGADAGVVFKVDATGHETTLYSFTAGADGAYPQGHLTLDSSGNLYGTNQDVVYKLQTNGGQLQVLFSFTQDGAFPVAGVVLHGGYLYGTTVQGGAANGGVAYKVDPLGHTTILYTFNPAVSGWEPWAGVIADGAGNLYGTTLNATEVYELNATGHETVLFQGQGPAGGTYPNGVIRDSAGNLYGTMSEGGNMTACFGFGCGVVYKLDPTGHQTVLHTFSGGRDGGVPLAAVIRDAQGNLYGTTYQGGSCCGVVYEVHPSGHEQVLYTFTGGADGGGPAGGVISDAAGNLYGTTSSGGQSNMGVVYKIDTAGQETVLYSFKGGTDGAFPQAGVTADSAGNLYGTTACGGTGSTTGGGQFTCGNDGAGVVFKLDAGGQETVLYTFAGGTDGAIPVAAVVLDSQGNLYGTTNGGGAFNAGVVFKLPGAAVPARE